MDGTRFDRLTRAVVGGSRRAVLRTALGGAAAAAAGAAAFGTGGDAKKKCRKCRRKRCKPAAAQGEPCASNKDCCANETKLACTLPNGVSQFVCCGATGAPCGAQADCCRGLICFEGECLLEVL